MLSLPLSQEVLVKIANAEELARQVSIASLAVIIWDMLVNLDDELELSVKQKFGLQKMTYILARLSSLSFALANVLYLCMFDISDCNPGHIFIVTSFVVSSISVALLFLFRVRAVFHGSFKTQVFFTILWVGVLATSILHFLFVKGVRSVTNPRRCTYGGLRAAYGMTAIAMALIFDTAVYVGISYRLFLFFRLDNVPNPMLSEKVSESSEDGSISITTTPVHARVWERVQAFISGKDCPAFSKSLLRDGQLYYLISFFISTPLLIMLFIPALVQYNLIFIPPYNAFTTIISCYVFRNVKLGRIREEEISTAGAGVVSQIRFRRGGDEMKSTGVDFDSNGNWELQKTSQYTSSLA